MFVSCDALNSVYERRSGLALLRQHAPTLGRDFVEAAAPLVGLFDPDPLDPSTLLEAIQQTLNEKTVRRDHVRILPVQLLLRIAAKHTGHCFLVAATASVCSSFSRFDSSAPVSPAR